MPKERRFIDSYGAGMKQTHRQRRQAAHRFEPGNKPMVFRPMRKFPFHEVKNPDCKLTNRRSRPNAREYVPSFVGLLERSPLLFIGDHSQLLCAAFVERRPSDNNAAMMAKPPSHQNAIVCDPVCFFK